MNVQEIGTGMEEDDDMGDIVDREDEEEEEDEEMEEQMATKTIKVNVLHPIVKQSNCFKTTIIGFILIRTFLNTYLLFKKLFK